MERTESTYNGYRAGVAELFTALSAEEEQELIRLLASLREALRREGFAC
jgi:flagellar motor component MotA